jgi:hypothetical protein
MNLHKRVPYSGRGNKIARGNTFIMGLTTPWYGSWDIPTNKTRSPGLINLSHFGKALAKRFGSN